MSTKPTTLSEVLEAAVNSKMADTYHVLPGIVVAYYPTTQDADIQIALDDPRFDPDTDERIDEPWPIWPHMRVAWPRFGGFTVIGPLAQGQAVQVFFQDLDDSSFRVTGQSGPPQNTRRHGSDSAFCVPLEVTDKGIAADGTASGSAMIMGADGAEGQIRLTQSGVQLGRTGADYVALASKVATELANIAAALNSLAVPITGPVGSTPVAASKPYSPGTVASTVVKSD